MHSERITITIPKEFLNETKKEAERHIKDFQDLKPGYGFRKTVFQHVKNIFKTCEEYEMYKISDERELALSKLTEREKEILGLKK